MPLIVTGIDPVSLPDSPVVDQAFYGPLKFGTKLYTWGFAQVGHGIPNPVAVYRSSDNGATWTGFFSTQTVLSTGWYDAGNQKIVFLMSDAGGAGLFFVDFLLSTETFSAPYGQFFATSTTGYFVRKLSTGDLAVICDDGLGNLLWVKFSSGAWGTPVTVNSTAFGFFRVSAVLDTSDNIWVFWWVSSPPNTVRVRSVSVSGVLGTVATVSTTGAGANTIGNGTYWSVNNGINVHEKAGDLPANDVFAERVFGAPISGPTWSEEFIDHTNLTTSDYGQMRVEAGNLLVDDIINDNGTGIDNGIFKAVFASGSWTNSLQYDCLVNYPSNLTPPVGSPAEMQGISGSDSGWIVRINTHSGGRDQNTLAFIGATTPPSLTCPSSNATVGVPYSSAFVATGGTTPYTFAIIAGSLPPGLTLTPSTGAVTGTPTTAGTYSYTGQVTDANGLTVTASCSITVVAALTGSCPSPSTIAVGVPFSGTVSASGGTPPYTFALTGGSLPPGLSLNTSTGVISGTPTTAGTFPYQITTTDSVGGTFVLNCSFGVSSCPSFTLVQECSPIR